MVKWLMNAEGGEINSNIPEEARLKIMKTDLKLSEIAAILRW